MLKSATYIATPPGETIREQLIDRGMTQKELAARMDLSEKHISKLINGEVSLTPDVAYRLELVLGVPARFWNNLEAIYRDKLVKAKAENQMNEDKAIAHKLPCSELSRLGWIATYSSINECVKNLRKFFEVASLKLILNPQIMPIAWRRTAITDKSEYALIAWAQRAKIEARSVRTEPINMALLKERIQILRRMTKENPRVFCPRLKNMLAECGIALIFLPHLKSTFLHGATFIDGSKIIIALTVRGKYADKFWFSFFHEIAHIIYKHIYTVNNITQDDEERADRYARDILIPPDAYVDFVNMRRFDSRSVANFALKIEIDAGIVVGRLQKDNYIKFNVLNNLKTKYEMNNN